MIDYVKKLLITCIILFSFLSGKADDGKTIFSKRCSACHTIGKGPGMGPDLKDLRQRRSDKWLVSFIQSPTNLIKKGDSTAVSLYNEYNKFTMPSQKLSAEQIKSILNYIDTQSSETKTKETKSEKADNSYTPQDIQRGYQFFTGTQRFTKHGASCISCHKVDDKRIFAPGTLAKELSHTYKMMGTTGISAILKNPPFPLMKAAYKNNPLQKEEIIALTAYLKSVGNTNKEVQEKHTSSNFAVLGIGLFILILLSTLFLYRNRKKKCVNQDIYSRQSI